MLVVMWAAAALAGIVHVLFFCVESLWWTTPAVYRRFRSTAEQAQTTKSLALNQGFYNLFLAAGALGGLALIASGRTSLGLTLVTWNCATMLALVEGLGVSVARHDPHAVTLHARAIQTTRPNPDLLRKIRGALVLMGPLLAREGRAEFGHSGGDRIGRRRIDSHVIGLVGLGAAMQSDAEGLTLSASRLHGQDILLDEASVTATENVILAAVLAEGTTTLRHAASEPHVQGLCVLLQSMGAQIEGVGSNLLTIRGGRALTGADFVLGPDFMEIGSFVVLGALAGDEVVIEDVRPDDLRMTLAVFERLGIVTKLCGRDLVVPGEQRLEIRADLGDAIPRVEDGPWPAFPADLMSVALVA